MERLVILGSHLYAEEIADIADDTGLYEVVAFVENWDRERCRTTLLGKPVIWIEEMESHVKDCLAICSIGSTKRSAFVEQVTAMGMRFAVLRHPTARVSSKAALGPGCSLNAGAVVASGTTLGAHVIVNRGALIGHHTSIGDYVTISPGANIGGAITIGDGAYIGMGATILERLKIGKGAIVGAGAVVTKDVPDRALVMGVPARIVREGVEAK